LLQFIQLETAGNSYYGTGPSYPAYVNYNRKTWWSNAGTKIWRQRGKGTGSSVYLDFYLNLEDIPFLALQSTGFLKNYSREEEKHRQNKIPYNRCYTDYTFLYSLRGAVYCPFYSFYIWYKGSNFLDSDCIRGNIFLGRRLHSR